MKVLVWATRLGILATGLAAVVVTWLQREGPVEPVLLALAVYLPWPWLVLPSGVGMLLSLALPVGRWWRALAVGVLLLVLVGVMGLTWGQPDRGAQPVRLMTYNAKVWLASQRPGGLDSLVAEVQQHDADVLLMQDAPDLPVWERMRPGWMKAMFGDRHVFARGQYVVASRWPLSGCRLEAFPGDPGGHGFVVCTVGEGAQRFTVISVHLVTPRQGLLAVRRQGLDGLEVWHDNVANRLVQARQLAKAIVAIQGPLVVAGDFNAPEHSAVVRQVTGLGLRDAWASAAFGYGYTHGHSLKSMLWHDYLRIDHILVSPDVGVASIDLGGTFASEHRPIVSTLWLKRE